MARLRKSGLLTRLMDALCDVRACGSLGGDCCTCHLPQKACPQDVTKMSLGVSRHTGHTSSELPGVSVAWARRRSLNILLYGALVGVPGLQVYSFCPLRPERAGLLRPRIARFTSKGPTLPCVRTSSAAVCTPACGGLVREVLLVLLPLVGPRADGYAMADARRAHGCTVAVVHRACRYALACGG